MYWPQWPFVPLLLWEGSRIVYQGLGGHGQLLDSILLFRDCLLVGHEDALLSDGIEGLLDVYQELLRDPF